MSPPNRPSVDRRSFLSAMAAMSAAVGTFSLLPRAASAVHGEPLGFATRAAGQRGGQPAHAAHTVEGSASIDPMTSTRAQDNAIRPFVVDVPDADIDDLRRRIASTRWPDRETVTDRSQGAPLEKLESLVRYWGTEYDWRNAEATLNALPQFTTNIDGVDIHFIHVRSRHP